MFSVVTVSDLQFEQPSVQTNPLVAMYFHYLASTIEFVW
jgi:hypothetical protein